MSLADYQPIRETVMSRTGNLTVTVRGLSLDDVVVLFNKHLDDINKMFDLFAGDKAVTIERFNEGVSIATRLVSEAPQVAARVIALASDEPEQFDQARKLTIPLQIEIIRRIVELTFDEAGGVRNFLASFRQMLGGLIPAMTASDT